MTKYGQNKFQNLYTKLKNINLTMRNNFKYFGKKFELLQFKSQNLRNFARFHCSNPVQITF